MVLHTFPLRAAFLALPLEYDAKDKFKVLQQSVLEFAGILRFQKPQSPHLTLQYWPELMEIEYHQVLPQAAKIASLSTPFDLRIQGISTFGSRGQDSVIYLDVPFSEELARLKKRFPWPNPPDKPFRPHITLARIRHPQKFAVHKKKILKLLGNPAFAMQVDRIRLYAEIEAKKQTYLRDFLFPLSS